MFACLKKMESLRLSQNLWTCGEISSNNIKELIKVSRQNMVVKFPKFTSLPCLRSMILLKKICCPVAPGPRWSMVAWPGHRFIWTGSWFYPIMRQLTISNMGDLIWFNMIYFLTSWLNDIKWHVFFIIVTFTMYGRKNRHPEKVHRHFLPPTCHACFLGFCSLKEGGPREGPTRDSQNVTAQGWPHGVSKFGTTESHSLPAFSLFRISFLGHGGRKPAGHVPSSPTELSCRDRGMARWAAQ